MSHKHALTTFTPDFKINAITREVIQVQPEVLITLMQYDHNSEKLRFECPRYIDGHDMSLCNKVEVHFVNSDVAASVSKGGYYTVTDIAVNSIDPSLVNFSWVVSRNSTENVGTLVFSVRFVCVTGDTIDYVWHTLPFTYVSVDQGLVNELDPDYQKVYLDNLETEAGKKVVEAANATTTALEAAERASEAINDLYSMDVTDKAPAIVCEASGEVISITDSAKMPLKGLRLFGKSTQDGTPTPDAPVEIKNVEKPVVSVYGKNLLKNEAVTQTLNGVTFTVNYKDGSFTVKGTATAMAFFGVDYNVKDIIPGEVYCLSGCPAGGSGSTYQLYAQTNDGRTFAYDTGAGVQFTGTDAQWQVLFVVYKDAVVDLTVYPMLRHASVTDTAFEPYKSPQTIELTHTLPGIPVTSGGNYTDSNGQQWICDEVDLERGVYIKRVGVINGYAGEEINGAFISTTGELSNEATVLYIQPNYIETPLTETEIAAYKALHTNKPNTIILNDCGAWQSVEYVADTKRYIDNKFAELANR